MKALLLAFALVGCATSSKKDCGQQLHLHINDGICGECCLYDQSLNCDGILEE